MPQVNPEHLDHLAELLEGRDGQSGAAHEIQRFFNRASALDARNALTPLAPVQTWASETAVDLRDRAEIARGDDGGRSFESFMEGFGLFGGAKDAVMAPVAVWMARNATSVLTMNLGLSGHAAPIGGLATNLALLSAGEQAIGLFAPLGRAAFNALGPRVSTFLAGTTNAMTQNIFAAGSSAGFLRWAGFGGSILGAGLGAADLVSQGNPFDAFRNDRSAYTVDVTGTLFNASMAAALAFPGPWTAIPAGVLAVAYGGALIWDNWETISGWPGATWNWTVDAWDTTTGAVGDAWNTTTDAVTDFASDPLGTVTDAATELGTAADMVGGATDAAGDFVEGAGDLLGGMF